MKRISILIMLAIQVMFCQKYSDISIIPKPQSVVEKNGEFILDENVVIRYDENNAILKQIAEGFIQRINKSSGIGLNCRNNYSKIIQFVISESNFTESEGYKIEIDKQSIILNSASERGIFYALQSLYQIMPSEVYSEAQTCKFPLSIKCMTIVDNPSYTYRGAMLDVSRHFFPVKFIKRFIDVLAFHKMNRFHWHLTDDQGWRIEIKKYPELTSIGSIRKKTSNDDEACQGYYTQEEIRDVVRYAQDRFIDIIPEIEMPGHSRAALAAYPELSCTGIKQDVATTLGVHEDIYCAGNEKVFSFLQDVLDEVIDLFPGKYIHIGGDEAPKTRWKECDKCQSRIKSEGLKDEYELQSYFIRLVGKYLTAKDKRMIGWDEILEGGLAPNAVVMSWRGIQGGVDAVKEGHDVIMSPNTHCYFDYYQAESNEPFAIGGYTPLEKVYSYNPTPEEINVQEAKHILGAQANLWTEHISSPYYAEYMLLPRLSALAEVLWTKTELKDYEDFSKRMIEQYQRYGVIGLNYRVPAPVGLVDQKIVSEPCVINITAPFSGSSVKYTIDGSDPDKDSETFVDKLEITKSTTIKARTLMPDGTLGHVQVSSISIIDSSGNGLKYKYYEGGWTKLPEFISEKVIHSGSIYKIGLDNVKRRGDHFALLIEGYLKIDKSNDYRFYLISDDGSKLIIDDDTIIDNDGSHSRREMSNTKYLKSGYHKIEIQYFEDYEGEALEVMIEGSNYLKRDIPASMLFQNYPEGSINEK